MRVSKPIQFLGWSFCLSVLVATSTFARPLSWNEKRNDLDQIFAMIESGYGPLEFKASRLGVTTTGLRKKYEPLVLSTSSNRDFYYSIVQLIAEFQDGHFSASVPSQLSASLPLVADWIEGKVLIDQIDLSKFPAGTPELKKGDEIVAIDGKPALEVVKSLEPYIAMANPQSKTRIATMALFSRSGARLPVPAPGKVSIQVQKAATGETVLVELTWKISGEAIDENALLPSFDASSSKASSSAAALELSSRDILEGYLPKKALERSFRCSGKTRIAPPDDATVLMTDPFVAYFFPTPKGNLGYLRIPHYSPQDPVTGATLFRETFAQYQWAVRELEKNTVGLIIDQDHNCGGSVDYMESLVGLFVDRPYAGLEFQFRASKPEYLAFRGYALSSTPNTIEQETLFQVASIIRKAWDSGQFLTEKTTFNAGHLLSPNAEVRYTKPIVILIDEMSGSGGDAFPALMQGYGRAKLIGSATMGLGGHVQEQPALGSSGIRIRMTRSLFFRPDGVPVENNGAVPDYPYTITREDFTNGYQGYLTFAISKLFESLP
ncbi:MAG: hypothetical protein RJB38_2465 [Pseudomonadota bacterium]|jgi:C-terminal processing protease CtpA/Prc